MFAPHGRLFSGLLFEEVYSYIDTASEVKYIRIASLIGWIINAFLLFRFSNVWVKRLNLPPYLPFLLAIFCICSSSTSIYIGWSSSGQVFLAFLAGLISGHILFLTLSQQKDGVIKFFIAVVLGVISLLIYQTGFGIFLLPFILVWISNVPRKKKILVKAVAVYLITYLVYFVVFKLYQSNLHVPDDPRTELVFQPLKKISFFFSTPFSQAWSLNLLHNLHNIFSQILPFILLLTWLILYRKQTNQLFIQVAGIIFFLFLSYLPSIIAKENFSSYRTMFAMNISVFTVFMITVFNSIQKERTKRILLLALPLFFSAIAFLNFNKKFADPLRNEFTSISEHPILNTVSATDTIIIIRPDSKLFQRMYGIKSYKDEYGLPGTYRDWTPENLFRQLIEEKQSNDIAKAVTIYNYAHDDSVKIKSPGAAIINLNEVISKSKEGK